jgi:hypothetical protein
MLGQDSGISSSKEAKLVELETGSIHVAEGGWRRNPSGYSVEILWPTPCSRVENWRHSRAKCHLKFTSISKSPPPLIPPYVHKSAFKRKYGRVQCGDAATDVLPPSVFSS